MTEEIKTKVCTICGQEKPLDEFYACAKSRDGKGSYCKLCANEYTRQRIATNPEAKAKKKQYNQDHQEDTRIQRRGYREEHREELREYGRDYYKTYPIKPLIYEARKRAKKLGIECTITEDDIVIPEFCPVLGIPIVPYQTENNRDSCPSLDRISLQHGYVPGNVAVMSYRANRLKNDGTIDEHDKLLTWMLEQPILLKDLKDAQTKEADEEHPALPVL